MANVYLMILMHDHKVSFVGGLSDFAISNMFSTVKS